MPFWKFVIGDHVFLKKNKNITFIIRDIYSDENTLNCIDPEGKMVILPVAEVEKLKS
jgi:hypothetical protein